MYNLKEYLILMKNSSSEDGFEHRLQGLQQECLKIEIYVGISLLVESEKEGRVHPSVCLSIHS
jgi:hypothetical protein